MRINKILFYLPFLFFISCNKDYQYIISDLMKDYISANELKYMIDHKEDYYLIDLRSSSEYREYHIPTAVNIPYNKISDITNKKIFYRPIIIYSHSQEIQKSVLNYLKSLGYDEVKILNGGIRTWSYDFVSSK